jgi:hypothetical protein
VAAICTAVCIIFCAIVYRESLPSLVNSPVKPTFFSLKNLSPNQPRHRRSGSTISVVSETETLVDPESGGADKSLLKGGSIDGEVKDWGLWDLMAHKPMQILSATMFLNQYVRLNSVSHVS